VKRIDVAKALVTPGHGVRYYPRHHGLSIWSNGLNEGAVSGHVRKMIADDHVELVDVPDMEWKRVRLTAAGQAWLDAQAKAGAR
jgi:hypothetical protein